MSVSPSDAVLVGVITKWLDDPESAVVYAEELDGRWAVRMTQETRDFTTVWFTPDERTLRYEAYVLPNPSHSAKEVYRQCLFRNQSQWRTHFSIRRDGGIYLEGRMLNEAVTEEELGFVLGEIYQSIEVSFRALLGAGYRPK